MSKDIKSITKAVSAIIVIVVIVIAGAGGYYYYSTTIKKPTPSSPPTQLSGSITVLAQSGYNDAALKQIAANFMASHPNTTVTIDDVPYSSEVTTVLTAEKANQSIYDIITTSSTGFIGPLGPYLLDLSPYLQNSTYFPPSWNASDVIQSLYQLYTENGEILAIPMTASTFLLYYRPSYFTNATNQQEFRAQYGYPLPNPGNTTLTLQQLVDVATFFNGAHGSQHGIVLMSDSGDDDMIQTYVALLDSARFQASSSMGPVTTPYGAIFTSTGQPIINTTVGENVLRAYLQLVNVSDEPLVASFETAPNLFASGGAAMMIYQNIPALYLSNPNRSNITNDWAVAPSFPGGYSNLGGEGFSIMKNTKNLPLALAFLEYMTSPNESVYFTTIDSLMPFRYSGFASFEASNPTYQVALQAIASNLASSVAGYSNAPYWTQIATNFAGQVPYIYNSGHFNNESIVNGANTIEQDIYNAMSSSGG
ncbi:MAG: extracellular solute-binding protein [Nitrososphaerota archaeon]|jgi:ABC-type glycerol-3-phosphate transport system substrate-binding protein|nr:extracellular solute-binding protein [Nitrososphaerota archaeon]MDG7037004.1 extracellular solute-binding protein [Nitrososphaerota archaeon]MDG7039073.1 extracellular solute-binding protein [Nitrososphaerota archaeon]MDG7040584.1 extracellular solute-binding protein [Nitrososphaerota archaeon]MDG7045746.1 extracellular solute-binding protein [Nitrososphaerota archaeon]